MSIWNSTTQFSLDFVFKKITGNSWEMNNYNSFSEIIDFKKKISEKFDSEIKRLKTLNSEHIIKIQDYFIED